MNSTDGKILTVIYYQTIVDYFYFYLFSVGKALNIKQTNY